MCVEQTLYYNFIIQLYTLIAGTIDGQPATVEEYQVLYYHHYSCITSMEDKGVAIVVASNCTLIT